MRKWLVRSKENSKNIGIADTRSSYYPGTEIDTPKEEPLDSTLRL